MTITLTPELEKFVAEQIKNGAYRSPDDIIVQSLGMLRAQEEFIRSNVAELREAIEIGMSQIRSGDVIDGKTAIQNIREKLRQRERGG
jgi:antitoxin ParD1/3/4